jgi:hypothetical protein
MLECATTAGTKLTNEPLSALLLLPHVQAHGHKIDFDDWHAAVHHTLDYQQLLHEDPALRQLLFNIGAERHLLTNADALHAGKCLQRLGLEGCFQVSSRGPRGSLGTRQPEQPGNGSRLPASSTSARNPHPRHTV